LARWNRVAKADASTPRGASMSGIAAIVIFLLFIGALNLFEFGRLD
jgi:hypothetical protein